MPLSWLCCRHNNQIAVVIEPGLHIIVAAFLAQSRPMSQRQSSRRALRAPKEVLEFPGSSFSRHSWAVLARRRKLCRTLASADVMAITDLLFGYPIIFWTAADDRQHAQCRPEADFTHPCREPTPELRVPNAAAQTRIVSEARMRLDSRKSVQTFKAIICVDISEFESSHPSQRLTS